MRFPLAVAIMFGVGFLIGFHGFQPTSDAGVEPILRMPTDVRSPTPMGGPFVPLAPGELRAPGFPALTPYPPEQPRVLEPHRLPVSEDDTDFG